MRRTVTRALVPLAGVLLGLAASAPAAAAPAPPAQRQVRTGSLVGSVPGTATRISAHRTGATASAAPQQAAPGCNWYVDTGNGNQLAPSRWYLNWQWWYDTNTRVTVASQVSWGAELVCNDMAYTSISSNLFFRNQQVSLGSSTSCGQWGSTVNNGCGDVLTSGQYPCAGAGNCDGSYVATYGWTVNLPAGWQWGTVPGSCSVLYSTELLCVYTTPPAVVPPVN